jgi:hypothetical protein
MCAGLVAVCPIARGLVLTTDACVLSWVEIL